MTTASVFPGIKLSNQSRSQLLDMTRATFGRVLPIVKAQHLTTKFRGSVDKIPKEVMGEMVEMLVIRLIDVDGIQVVEVEPLGIAKDLEYASTPHITIATAEGVKPSTSKKILRDHAGVEVPPLVLRGQVGFVHDRHGWVFTHLSEAEMVATPRV